MVSDQTSEQRVPGLRIGVHERFGLLVVPARTTFDQIRRQSERRSGKADQRRGAQLGGEKPNGLRDCAYLFGDQSRECCNVGDGANRIGDHRSDAGNDVEIDSRSFEWNDDVREQDCRVHVVTAHRLHRDLTDQRRIETRFQHADPGADLAVLRQRTPGLTHEPHRPSTRSASGRRGKQRCVGQDSPSAVLRRPGNA